MDYNIQCYYYNDENEICNKFNYQHINKISYSSSSLLIFPSVVLPIKYEIMNRFGCSECLNSWHGTHATRDRLEKNNIIYSYRPLTKIIDL